MDNNDIVEEIREELQIIADHKLRLNRFENRLRVFLSKLELEEQQEEYDG